MPQPTRAEFDAAAKRVMQTAGPGLSREQFFAKVNEEIAKSAPVVKNGLPPTEHGYSDIGDQYKGPDTWVGGFLKPIIETVTNNPLVQSTAQPRTTGDFLNLILPDSHIAGKAIQTAIQKAPNLIEKFGAGLENIGKAGRSMGLPLGVYEAVSGSPKVGAAIAGAPVAAELAGKGAKAAGRALGQPVFAEAAEDIGGMAAGYDRYMPNSSTAQGSGTVSRELSGVPYSTPTPRPNPGEVGRLTGGRAQSNEDILADALNEALVAEPPTQVSGAPSVLSQTDTGRPAVTGQRYDEIVGGIPEDAPRSTDMAERIKYNKPDEFKNQAEVGPEKFEDMTGKSVDEQRAALGQSGEPSAALNDPRYAEPVAGGAEGDIVAIPDTVDEAFPGGMYPDEVNGRPVSKTPAPEGYDLEGNGGILPDGSISQEGYDSYHNITDEDGNILPQDQWPQSERDAFKRQQMEHGMAEPPSADELARQFEMSELDGRGEAYRSDLFQMIVDHVTLDENPVIAAEVEKLAQESGTHYYDAYKQWSKDHPGITTDEELANYGRNYPGYGSSMHPDNPHHPFTDSIMQDPNWHSGADKGSEEARQAESLHRSQGANEERLKYLWMMDELGDK